LIIKSLGEVLTSTSKKKVENWEEYWQLDQFLINFYSISVSEALNSSKELKNMVQQLKDSVKIERFKKPDIKIRLNVLYRYYTKLAILF
jgi:hypothetical protein